MFVVRLLPRDPATHPALFVCGTHETTPNLDEAKTWPTEARAQACARRSWWSGKSGIVTDATHLPPDVVRLTVRLA